MVELKRKKPQIKWTDDKKKYLLDNYEYGDLKEICIYIGCTYKSLKSMAIILGVKSLKDKNHFKLKKLLDDNNFNYYWWGYILADGHINNRGSLNISICEKDNNHLLKLTDYLGVKLNTRFIKTEYSEGYQSFLSCQDSLYGEKLKRKLGISETKTYNCIDFSFIDNEDLFMSIFIGFYDGDGCISNYNKKNEILSIKIECHNSWMSFFIFCKEKLKEYLNIESTVTFTKKDSVIIRICGKSNIEDIRNYAINKNLPIMIRKWIK
jgi:DNA-binding transcriptional regulator WhiA